MIDWTTLGFERWWPAYLFVLAGVSLLALWRWRRAAIFPDVGLIIATRRLDGLPDRIIVIAGWVLLAGLTLTMMRPSVKRVETVEQRARDFVILVDTSRSMRHDTQVTRDTVDLTYERRAGAFFEAVDDPNTIPFVARFELARESLFRFLNGRNADDRVALLYFNDDVHPVSALTGNMAFLTEQLGTMDDYVNWGTNIAAAMDSSLSLLGRYPGHNKRTMILITDAETRFTEDLQAQFARLANAGLSFYLLWITADDTDLSTDDANDFLELGRTVGTVVTIKDPNADNLREALLDISRSEGYRYDEIRHTSVDLAEPVQHVVRLLLLAWLLAAATLMHPTMDRSAFEIRRAFVRRTVP